MVDALDERVQELRERAIEYHTAVKAPEDGLRIKRELQSLIAAIGNLRLRKPKHYNLTAFAMEFRQAATGGYFDSAERKPVGHNDAVVVRIWTAGDALIDGLRAEFERANTD